MRYNKVFTLGINIGALGLHRKYLFCFYPIMEVQLGLVNARDQLAFSWWLTLMRQCGVWRYDKKFLRSEMVITSSRNTEAHILLCWENLTKIIEVAS